MIRIDVVDVPHFSLMDLLEAADARLEQRRCLRELFHVCTCFRLLPLKGCEGRRLWRGGWDRSTRMAWKGKFFWALIGFLITRNVWGGVIGAIIGHMFDQSAGLGHGAGAYATAAAGAGGAPYASISEVFFRTTFELIGH